MLGAAAAPAAAVLSSKDKDKLEKAESGGEKNPSQAVSSKGAVGVRQIMPSGALADWNQNHPKEKHTAEQLKDDKVNRKISDWYLDEKIPAYLKTWGIPVTKENVQAAYNMGPTAFHKYHQGKRKMPKETKGYIKKLNSAK
jgi:soluble lytic murein transglycosylase-like protein